MTKFHVLNITWVIAGTPCHCRLIFAYNYTFYASYNRDQAANMDFNLDPTHYVIKGLWCTCMLKDHRRVFLILCLRVYSLELIFHHYVYIFRIVKWNTCVYSPFSVLMVY